MDNINKIKSTINLNPKNPSTPIQKAESILFTKTPEVAIKGRVKAY